MTRPKSVWKSLLLLGALALSAPVQAGYYFVDPDGDDEDNGLTPDTPLETVQSALEMAHPGDTVVIMPGTYDQDLVSVRDGLVDAPIRIQGSNKAIITGGGKRRVIELQHSFIELVGFTVNGKFKSWLKTRYRGKLVYAKGEQGIGLKGIRILGLQLLNAGSECLRLKYAVTGSEVAYNTIKGCGLDDMDRERARNGEAIYVGTALPQLEGDQLDSTNNNHIHHNFIRTVASECVDLKEGASFNLIEHNICIDQRDPRSGGISVRGDHNIIRHNAIGPTIGAGIRVGNNDYGQNNSIYDNQLHDNKAGSINLRNLAQKLICGNQLRQPDGYPGIRVPKGAQPPKLLPCEPLTRSIN